MDIAVALLSRSFVAFIAVYISTALGGYVEGAMNRQQYSFAHDLFNSPKVIGIFHAGLNDPVGMIALGVVVVFGAFFLTSRKGMWLLLPMGLADGPCRGRRGLSGHCRTLLNCPAAWFIITRPHG